MAIKDIFVWVSCIVIALAVLLSHFWMRVNSHIEEIQNAHSELAQVRHLSDQFRAEIHKQSSLINEFVETGDQSLLHRISILRYQFGWQGDPWQDATTPKGHPSLVENAVSIGLDEQNILLFKKALMSAGHFFKAQNDRVLFEASSSQMSRSMFEETQLREDVVLTAISKLMKHTKLRADETISRAHKRIADIKPLITILFATLLATLTGCVLLFRNHVWLGLNKIRVAIIEMAEHDEYNTVLGLGRNDEVGDMARAVSKLREKTQLRLDRLHNLAFHDPLTGLENRTRLHDQLKQALRLEQTTTHSIWLFVIDLDKFKEVNDVYGHLIGDEVLRQTANRLRECAPAGAIVSRFGGDEFAMFAHLNAQEQAAENLGEAIASRLRDPISVSSSAWVSCAGSVGFARATLQDLNADDLMSKADAALYVAKDRQPGTACMYQDGMEQAMRKRRTIQDDLASAISTGQLHLEYQPQYTAETDALVGFEALLRWHHPKLGAISPADFIPVAEDTPLIIAIGRFCIEEAIGFAATWKTPCRVSINLSPGQFYDLTLVSFITKTLQNHRFPPHRFEVEITEGVLIADMGRATSILNDLRALGIQIALDDFGTGYSALSYLRTIPADRVKIDKSFIDPIENDPQAQTIVQSIIMIAKTVNMDVIAEGVETPAQREILKIAGCSEIQGYLMGRPLPKGEAQDLVDAGNDQTRAAFDDDTGTEMLTTQLDPRTGDVA